MFTAWKQWLHGCREARSREHARHHQQHKMAALLARVTAVCQHDPSTNNECRSSGVDKECHSVCHHDPSILKTKEQLVCPHNPSTLGTKRQPVCHHDPSLLGAKCHHNPSILKKEHTTPELITSKLVRQELVSDNYQEFI